MELSFTQISDMQCVGVVFSIATLKITSSVYSITSLLFFQGVFFFCPCEATSFNMGFGGGHGAAPTGLNHGGSVPAFQASWDSFQAAFLLMAPLIQ